MTFRSHPSPDRVRERLDAHQQVDIPPLPGRTNHLAAGVLVPLMWDPEPVVLLTLRASGLRHHAGEVCFPGGRPEDQDADLWATAVREAHEEIGLTGARRLGALSGMPVYTSEHRLWPFVAEVPVQPLEPHPGEVEGVLRLPLADVFGAETLDGIPYRHEGLPLHSPIFVVEDLALFGATAHALYELLLALEPLYGALPPFREGRFGWPDLLAHGAAAARR